MCVCWVAEGTRSPRFDVRQTLRLVGLKKGHLSGRDATPVVLGVEGAPVASRLK